MDNIVTKRHWFLIRKQNGTLSPIIGIKYQKI